MFPVGIFRTSNQNFQYFGLCLKCFSFEVGTVLAYVVLPPVPPHLAILIEEFDLNLSMPQLAKFTSFTVEWKQISQSLFDPARDWLQGRDFAVGDALSRQGITAKHPVILVPGVVSTGLESWSTSPEYRGYFRKRLWGTTTFVTPCYPEIMFHWSNVNSK